MDTHRRTIGDRLNIDGVRDYRLATGRAEKCMWSFITILAYFFAIYLSYLTAIRFGIGVKIISSEHQPPSNQISFPDHVTLCHTIFWNKTYLEENIQIPQHILEKASELGLVSKTAILSEFSKYISYYNLAHFEDAENSADQSESTPVLDLMDELYEYTFKEIDVSSVIADGSLQSPIVEKCWYKNQPFKCFHTVAFSIDSPSCHMIPTGNNHDRSSLEKTDLDRALVKFELNLPLKHIFRDKHQNLGIKIFFGETPSIFNPQWATPANTHATILYEHREQQLKSNCIRGRGTWSREFFWFQSYESCLAENFENASMSICKCHFIAGPYYPTNKLVCTPKVIRECVQTKVLRLFSEDFDEKYNSMKKCQRRCLTDNVFATVSFYDLENTSSDSIRNVITIRPNLDQGIREEEKDLTNIYGLFSEVGGVVGVYTGLSIAALVRIFALVSGAGLSAFNRRVIKPFVAGMMGPTPLSVRWDLISVLHFRRRNDVR